MGKQRDPARSSDFWIRLATVISVVLLAVIAALGTHRYVIEQTIALLHWFRRLRVRWEIRDDIHEVFMILASTVICWRRLNKTLC